MDFSTKIEGPFRENLGSKSKNESKYVFLKKTLPERHKKNMNQVKIRHQ
jgi:hypothetical protein